MEPQPPFLLWSQRAILLVGHACLCGGALALGGPRDRALVLLLFPLAPYLLSLPFLILDRVYPTCRKCIAGVIILRRDRAVVEFLVWVGSRILDGADQVLVLDVLVFTLLLLAQGYRILTT